MNKTFFGSIESKKAAVFIFGKVARELLPGTTISDVACRDMHMCVPRTIAMLVLALTYSNHILQSIVSSISL